MNKLFTLKVMMDHETNEIISLEPNPRNALMNFTNMSNYK